MYKPLRKRLETYRNVYATEPGPRDPIGGLALHHELLEKLRRKGVGVVSITLHIGLMESPTNKDIVEGTSKMIESARNGIELRHRRNEPSTWHDGAAVESSLWDQRRQDAQDGRQGDAERDTSAGRAKVDQPRHLPGPSVCHGGRDVDELHEPRSSHLLLVAAFAGKEFMLDTYRELVL